MSKIFVARSPALSEWGLDVGLSKNLFKVGITEDPKALAEGGFAGFPEWTVVKTQDAGDVAEADVLARLAKKATLVDPTYYPRIRQEPGIFKVLPNAVANHLLINRALSGEELRSESKLRVTDFASYLIANGLG